MSSRPAQASEKPQSRRRIWLFRLMAFFLSVLAIELLLQVVTLISPAVHWKLQPGGAPIMLADERLGFVPNPDHPDHDAWGFRNAAVLSQASVVILGDSQTYGMGVKPNEAWPRILAAESGKETYNIAFGGWGPAHFLSLWDKAASLRPETIIVAFYAGNDLYDCYSHVHDRKQFPELRTTDADLLESISTAEQREPLKEVINRAFRRAYAGGSDKAARRAGFRSAVKWLAGSFRIAGIAFKATRSLRGTPKQTWEDVRRACEGRDPYRVPIEVGSFRTTLTPGYRLLAVDLDDPRVREGQRIALESLSRLHQQARTIGARFLVVLIPTKELAFKSVVSNAGPISPAYNKLIGYEQTMWQTTRSHLEERAIPYLDTLPALRASLEQGRAPYPMHWDGHPNAAGHRAIARVVLNELRKQREEAPQK